MKILTQQQIKDHTAASRRGAIEGAVFSGIPAVAGSYVLHRRWPYYRSLPFSLKTLGVIFIVAPCLAIQAERRGLEYDRSQWEKDGRPPLEYPTKAEKAQAAEQAKNLQVEMAVKPYRIGEWVDKYKWPVIIGSWATGMAVSGTIISRNKYQTFGQKLVQARMWAQGVTIGVVIAAAILTQSQRFARTEQGHADHSWQALLEEQEEQKRAQRSQQA